MLIGNREWLSSNSVDLTPIGDRLDNFERQGSTVVLVAVDGELCISYYNHVSYECEVSVRCVCVCVRTGLYARLHWVCTLLVWVTMSFY